VSLWFRVELRGCHVVAFGGLSIGAGGPTGTAPLTEQGMEVLFEVRKACGEGILRLAAGGLTTRITGLPGLAAAWVGQHRIGLVDQLEALLRQRVIAVEVRMPAAGLGAKGPLETAGVGAGL
jgi:hypothetical protein